MSAATLGRYFPTILPEMDEYPSTDPRIMPESDLHRITMHTLIHRLMRFYETRPDVYVSGDLLIYYERGNKRKCIAPDCFVALGVPNMTRPNYLLWAEGKGPNVVFEIASPTTHKNDLKKKFQLYQDVLKVPEYFLFDPDEKYFSPSMQGYRLVDGVYQEVEPDANGRIECRELNLHLLRLGQDLRFWNPITQALIPTPEEELKAQARLLAETEATIAKMKSELDALRAAKTNGQHPN